MAALTAVSCGFLQFPFTIEKKREEHAHLLDSSDHANV